MNTDGDIELLELEDGVGWVVFYRQIREAPDLLTIHFESDTLLVLGTTVTGPVQLDFEG